MANLILHAKIVAIAIVLWGTSNLCAPNSLFAQCVVPRLHHPWGNFAPGAWKKVRVVTEDLDENGNVLNTSTTETVTKLRAIDDKTFTLLVDVTIEVAGQRFRSQPKLITKGYYGENAGQIVKVLDLGNERVSVDGKHIQSQVSRTILNGGQSKRETKIHYSDQVFPHVLKRETVATNLADESTTFKSRVEVTALGKPFHVLSDIRPTSEIRTIYQRSNRKTETTEVFSPEVPGGVVYHASKEFDMDGKLVRRSTLELIDYHAVDAGKRMRGRLMQRLRAWKQSRRTSGK